VEVILFKDLGGMCPFREGLQYLGAGSRAEFNRDLACWKRSQKTSRCSKSAGGIK
jgi:hypothetical protein